jgi:hypothetical protein
VDVGIHVPDASAFFSWPLALAGVFVGSESESDDDEFEALQSMRWVRL